MIEKPINKNELNILNSHYETWLADSSDILDIIDKDEIAKINNYRYITNNEMHYFINCKL